MATTVGYSRAMRVGDTILVSGTAPVMPDGGDPPADPYVQARRCLEIVVAALAELGAGAAHVVRTRTYLTRAEDWEEVGRAHGEVFGETRPATTMIVVSGLLDPRWLVEIEADAIVG
jgi:enamine deaminase RidA (YjgF/YER057c/UK114 family)